MSLEEALRENTEALKANTAAHEKLGAIATAAQGGEAETEATEEKKAPAKKAPAKKAPAKKPAAKKAEPPELKSSVTAAAIKKAAGAYLGVAEGAERDAHKANVVAAFAHLGVEKLGEIDNNEDRAKLAGYIAYWDAGLEVDFEAIDEIVAGDGDGDGEEEGGDDGDDLLG